MRFFPGVLPLLILSLLVPPGDAAATGSPGDHPDLVGASEAIRALGGSMKFGPKDPPSGGGLMRSLPVHEYAIRRVDLHGTAIGDADLARLAALPGLRDIEALDLRLTTVGDSAMASVRKFRKLRFLNLFRTRVGDAGVATLKPLAALDTLLLGGTRVSDEGLRHLRPFRRLRRLSLFDTQVGDAALPQLDALRHLEVVLVGRSRITEAGVARLRRTHPGLATAE